MKRFLAELLGTFVLIFMGCGSIVISQMYPETINHIGIALAFGIAVMVMIYAVGNVSGAHFNPAVTIGFMFAGKFDKKELPLYLLAQFIGASIGVITIKYFFLSDTLGMTMPSNSNMNALFVEIILTFILMTVILNISSGYKEKGMMAGVSVGFTVFLGALIGGPLTGASMNPIRSIAPALFEMNFTSLWLYIVGPIIGAVLAVPLYKIVQENE